MCGDRARTWFRISTAVRRGSMGRSSSVILAAMLAPSPGCGVLASDPASRASSARTSAGPDASAIFISNDPASSSRASGTGTDSMMGPVSSPASMSMMVVPVSVTPSMRARSTGAAPRYAGSSE